MTSFVKVILWLTFIIFYYIDNDTDKRHNVRMNEQRGEVMNFMTKEEFKKESNIEIIQKIMERNNGYYCKRTRRF